MWARYFAKDRLTFWGYALKLTIWRCLLSACFDIISVCSLKTWHGRRVHQSKTKKGLFENCWKFCEKWDFDILTTLRAAPICHKECLWQVTREWRRRRSSYQQEEGRGLDRVVVLHNNDWSCSHFQSPRRPYLALIGAGNMCRASFLLSCAPPLSTGQSNYKICVKWNIFEKKSVVAKVIWIWLLHICKLTMQYLQVNYFAELFRKNKGERIKMKKNILGYKCFSLHMHMIILYYIRILMTCQEIYI